MVELTINGVAVTAEEGTTILDAAKEHGMPIPTLCYLKGLCEIGACRVCCVEAVGEDKLLAACNTPVRQGMEILTHSERAETARRHNLSLLLSHHDRDCEQCARDHHCRLQLMLDSHGLDGSGLHDQARRVRRRHVWDGIEIIQRDFSKCIVCGRCVQVCRRIQGIGVWDYVGAGDATTIGVRDRLDSMQMAQCISCGQCITHCPTAALTERNDVSEFLAAVADPERTVVVQIAPAVRTAWAATLGYADGELGIGRIAAALKRLGADYVFDTTLTADLTIMEEGSELIERLSSGALAEGPMFTSCCPGWVNFVRQSRPEWLPRLSTAKSPGMMFASLIKTKFASSIDVDPERIFSVMVMPCTAKKREIGFAGMESNEGTPDADLSLTVREFVAMMDAAGIDPGELEDEPMDHPLTVGTGAGVIFGATGGVMEAALRSAHYLVTGENPDPDQFIEVRGDKPWREASFVIGETRLQCAIASGIASAQALLKALESGEARYDFVEIMACPGGCSGGGGQPIDGTDRELATPRGSVLYELDRTQDLRFSHENPTIKSLYEEFYEKPLSEIAERYLHVEHEAARPCGSSVANQEG